MSRVLVNRLNVREGPTVNSKSLAHYEAGDIIASGNEIILKDGRYWLQYTGGSGNQRYVCAWDSDGSQYVDVHPNVPGPRPGDWHPPPQGETVLASFFSDRVGYKGDNLYDGGMYYAELSVNPSNKDFSALGGLPYRQKMRITYKGKSVIAYKADIGAGGRNHPKIDLHINLARELGFNNGLDYVQIEKL